jgi:hypothetical protein
MTDDHSRCKECFITKRRLGWKRILKRNKILLGCIGLLWIYAVFPGPFFPVIDPTYYYTTLIAAILIMIPLGLASSSGHLIHLPLILKKKKISLVLKLFRV